MGKSKGKIALGILGAFIGGFNPGWFLTKSATLGALYGASLGTTIWGAMHPPKDGSSPKFDTNANILDSNAMIPIIYGTCKVGGIQSWHKTTDDNKNITKDIIIGEGEIEGVFGGTLNDLLVSNMNDSPFVFNLLNSSGNRFLGSIYTKKSQHIFAIYNANYSDATVTIWKTNFPTKADKILRLHANGKNKDIVLCDIKNDLNRNGMKDYNAYVSKLIQYISNLGDGWVIVDPVPTSNNCQDLNNLDTTNCYKNPISITKPGVKDCGYTLYNGSSTQSPPSNYDIVGGYKNMAWARVIANIGDDLQGGNPNFTCIVKGKKVKVFRDNKWYTEWSDNPAWCVRDFLLSKRYGTGRVITEAMLDDNSFKEAADYFDEVVSYKDSDGFIHYEKRCILDIVLNERKTPMEILGDIFATCGAFLVFTNNKIALRVEKSTEVSYVFNMDSIVEGSVSFAQTSLDNTPNRYEISYVDPNNNWQPIKVLVEDVVDQEQRQKIISKEISLKGVKRQSQALRIGRLYRDINRLNNIIITFQTTTFAMHLEPGDVVTVTYRNLVTDMPFRILEISEQKGIWTIKAQQYNESVYNENFDTTIQVKDYTTIESPLTEDVVDVTNITIAERFRELGNGTVVNEAELTWTNASSFYNSADVYMLSDNPTWDEIDVSFNSLDGSYESMTETTMAWKYVGNAYNNFYVSNLIKGIQYTFKIVAKNSVGRKADFNDAPTISLLVKGKSYTPTIPSGLTVNITDKCEWNWKANPESDIDFYELRLDTNVGETEGLLVKTSSTKTIFTPPSRYGTVYLFAHNTAEYYSDVCTLAYNKAAPIAPTNVTVTPIFQGLVITCDPLPTYCIGINAHINNGQGDKVFFSSNNEYTFKATSGIFDIQVAYVDIFGEGAKSEIITATIIPKINQELLDAEAVSLENMDNYIKGELEAGRVGYENTANIVAELNKPLNKATYTALAQTHNEIQLRAKSENLLSLINACPEAITLKSSLIHVSGDTLFDDNVIVNRMLAAQSITADKFSGNTIDLSGALKITTGASGVQLDNQGLKLTESTGAYTRFDQNGITWYSPTGVAYGAIRRTAIGTVQNGQYVRLNWNKTPIVLLSPKSFQTTVAGYNASDVQVVCQPYDISPSGFRVALETRLLSGNGVINYNSKIFDWNAYPSYIPTTITTPSAITSATITLLGVNLGGGNSDNRRKGDVKIRINYKKTTDTTWTDYGIIELEADGSVTVTRTIFQNMPAAAYNILVETVGDSNSPSGKAYLGSVAFNGGGVISTVGEVSFIAMETDNTDYYTIEA